MLRVFGNTAKLGNIHFFSYDPFRRLQRVEYYDILRKKTVREYQRAGL